MIKNFAVFLSVLTLGVAPSFAQETPTETMDQQPVEQQTIDQDLAQPEERRQPASNEKRGILPDAQIAQPQSGSQPQQPQPATIEEMRQGERGGQQPATAPATAQPETFPADEPSGRSQTAAGTGAPSTQTSFLEITPSIGAISIEDKTSFSVGTNISFRLSENSPLFFEPSFLVSFLSGDNNVNATLFHIDGGLRLDWIISGSPVVPFVKGAIGPTLSSTNNVQIDGNNISDSYFNAFAGGGLKVLINPRISARFDTGITFQGTNPGLYVLGAVGLPL